jgi:hypothetical protein
MSTDATNVRVAVTGALFKGPTTAPAPTDEATSPDVAFADLGFLSEDGIEISLPGAGDSSPVKAWQDGTVVRVIRTPSEDNPTYQFAMIEDKKETVETYFGVTITQTATNGTFTYEVKNRDHHSYIVDVVDGAELIRDYVPYGVVTDVESITLANTDAIAYGVTVEAERDPAKGFNFQRWSTTLKTVA